MNDKTITLSIEVPIDTTIKQLAEAFRIAGLTLRVTAERTESNIKLKSENQRSLTE